ncbi:universal stress protein [Haloarchaeobius amylolyticus]|uniref:universal stress protein n=1 Tax=Haloarchaeobius amylolyticus TaxID=1198296 RepID=UPI002271DF1E|nr:universal stress protein [Haloarchaeobius amylolyticus]
MRLLVAMDGSDAAENALTYAADICDATGGSITVVHAVNPAVYDTGGSAPISTLSDADRRLVVERIEDAEHRGEQHLSRATELAGDLGVSVETELLYGDPVHVITDYAEDADFDTIVVGHRGRSGRADSMLGSVAKQIVERATVPVTVVR